MTSIVIGLLFGHSQSVVIPGCGFGEVSKLAATVTSTEKGKKNREIKCSINDESETKGK